MIKRSNSSKQPRTLSTRELAVAAGGKALTLDLDVLALTAAASYRDNLTAWGASEIDLKA